MLKNYLKVVDPQKSFTERVDTIMITTGGYPVGVYVDDDKAGVTAGVKVAEAAAKLAKV